MKSNAPPLYIWIAVILLFLLGQLLMFFYSEKLFPITGNQTKHTILWTQRALAQNEVNKETYLNNQATYPDAYHIVAIGTSLTHQSIECKDEFLLACKEKYDTTLVITKFSSAARPLKAMSELGGMFDVLHQYKPELILIEADLISTDYHEIRFWGYPRKEKLKIRPISSSPIDYMRAVRVKALGVFEHNRLNFLTYAQSQKIHSGPPIHKTLCTHLLKNTGFSDTLFFEDKKRYPYTFERTSYCHDDLRRLKAMGTEIVIVHHPKPYPLEEKYTQDSAQAEIQHTLQQFQDSLGLTYWHCPLKLPFLYYQDMAHMAQKGRTAFSDWLMDKIYHEVIQP